MTAELGIYIELLLLEVQITKDKEDLFKCIPMEQKRCILDDTCNEGSFCIVLNKDIIHFSTHKVVFYRELTKIIFQLSSKMHHICLSGIHSLMNKLQMISNKGCQK